MSQEETLKKRPLRHPSWRVYKAAAACDLSVTEFGLKPNLDIYYPYTHTDELTEELIKAIKDPAYVDTTFNIGECLAIFLEINERQLIEAMLLENKSIAEISEVLDCDDNMVLTYASVFFDTSIFSNHIEKLVYIKSGTIGKDAAEKDRALRYGTDYLKADSNVRSAKTDIDSVLLDMFKVSYVKARIFSNSAEIDEQDVSQKWVKVMVDVAKQLKNTKKSNMSFDDLVINLTSTEAPSTSISDLLALEAKDSLTDSEKGESL